MPLHVSSTCAHREEVKIALHSHWYHHNYRWPFRVLCVDDRLVCRSICSCIPDGHLHRIHETATYSFDDTRSCVMQFWPPHDVHMCSKHVEAWNILIVKQKCCVSRWLITETEIIYVCIFCMLLFNFAYYIFFLTLICSYCYVFSILSIVYCVTKIKCIPFESFVKWVPGLSRG